MGTVFKPESSLPINAGWNYEALLQSSSTIRELVTTAIRVDSFLLMEVWSIPDAS